MAELTELLNTDLLEFDDIDLLTSRNQKIAALMKTIGQLITLKTVEGLSNPLLEEAKETFAIISHTLHRESEARKPKQEVNITPLLKWGATEEDIEKYRLILQPVKAPTSREEIAESMMQFFRENRHDCFTMDVAVEVARLMKLEPVLGKCSDGKLRIVLGAMFGRNMLNLVTTTASHQKLYHVPERPSL